MRSTLVALTIVATGAWAAAPSDQLPMYGRGDRAGVPELKAADDKLIAAAVRTFGSREKAAASWVAQGFVFYQQNDTVRAMRRFNQAWLLDPNNPEVYWGFAVVLHDAPRMCEAKAMIERALAFRRHVHGLYPDAARIISLCTLESERLSTVERESDFARAEALFSEAADKDRDKGYVYATWAMTLYQRGQYTRAWEMGRKSREYEGGLPEHVLEHLRERATRAR